MTKPKPLTKAERQWVDDLQAVLARCPERLELVTTGDADLRVFDGIHGKGLDLHDVRMEQQGIVLARIPDGPMIHGVSG